MGWTKNASVCHLTWDKAHIKYCLKELYMHSQMQKLEEKREGWEAEGVDLEEQAPHPESTLLQTWGHLNICLQHVHREFNQSHSETCTIVSGNKY